MTISDHVISERDPGLPPSAAGATGPVHVGTCELGVANSFHTFNNPSDALDTLGEGPLTESVCYDLLVNGGPVSALVVNGSVAGAAGAVSPTRTSTSTGTVTVAGAAKDAYEVLVEITKTGDKGVGRFRYSLDRNSHSALGVAGAARTYSPELLIPAGGAYVIPRTGLTITFVSGGGPIYHEAGDTHTFDCTAPYYSTTDLANAYTAYKAITHKATHHVLVGVPADAAGGNTMLAAFDTQLAGMAAVNRFVGGILDVGSEDTASNVAAGVTGTSKRAAACYGYVDMVSAKPFAGWGTPKRSMVVAGAGRANGVAISTDLARFVDGGLTGVTYVYHDEYRSPTLDVDKIATMRTYEGEAGYYITDMHIKSPTGSDFTLWQHRRVMSEAQTVAHSVGLRLANEIWGVKKDGTIIDVDAADIREQFLSALSNALLNVRNDSGRRGHVSALDYQVDKSISLILTGEVRGNLGIRPHGYSKMVYTETGFTLNV